MIPILFILIVLVRLVIAAFPAMEHGFQLLWQRTQQALKRRKTVGLFDDHFIEVKAFYFKEFKTVPCIAYIGNVDTGKIFEMIKNGKYGKVKATYQRNYYNWQQERIEFTKTIFKIEDNMMVKLGDDWLEILFRNNDYDRANKMLNEFKTLKVPQKENDYEINIISLSGGSLDLKTLAIKPTELDLNLYYNDDFKAIDAIIKERLSKENDKGIVLLHGLPGTGKTTYLRHLIGSMKKKVMFVSPSVAGNLMNPEFMDLLIDNPNAVLVIEDAENIIMDRRYSSQSSVSNLLNISDGLLSDCLNVQIICTFNSELSMVDSALLRKGRLIAKYEFGKLHVSKARALSQHLGLEQEIHKPMTLAEITNPDETNYEPKQVNVIGFRRVEELIEN
jgi:hypothetical protein